MSNANTGHIYRTFLTEAIEAGAPLSELALVKDFLRNAHPTRTQLENLYQYLTQDGRDSCEAVGFDVDMLPEYVAAEVLLQWKNAVPDELVPARVSVISSSSNPHLQAFIESSPGFEVITKYREWTIQAHPAVLPFMRQLVKQYQVEYGTGVLDNLKTLGAQNDQRLSLMGKVSFGPKKTVDIALFLTFPRFAEQIKTMFDARALSGNVYRMPAAKLREVLGFIKSTGYGFEYSSELQDVLGKSEKPLLWNGDLRSLSSFTVDELVTITAASKNALARNNINSAYQLLLNAPRKYIDRSNPTRIATLADGAEAALVATVQSVRVEPKRKMVIYQVKDSTGSINVSFFNAIWMAKKFKSGDSVLVFGKVASWGKSGPKRLGMTNPLMEHFTEQNLPVIPIYAQTSTLNTEDVRKAVYEILDRLTLSNVDEFHSAKHSGEQLLEALRKLHKPQSMQEIAESKTVLAYEELFRLQLVLAVEKYASEHRLGLPHEVPADVFNTLLSSLPYALTGAQERAWKEIEADLCSERPMHRLLQGDVGSGKTTLALFTLLAGVLSGRQSALLAPTEILASQLYENVSGLLEELVSNLDVPIRAELFTNKLRGKAREKAYQDLAAGEIHIAVGTHALLSEGVEFENLGVVVVDEQHRFGVEQRAKLSQSRTDEKRPDMLVMTATPIPRTAALTVFGALDVSVLDELPPGRVPINTVWVDSEISLTSKQAKSWQFMSDAVKNGQQGYVVCPLVEESDKLQVASATETFDKLKEGALKGLSLGLVHGQMKADEKTETMARFRNGEIDVLVSTTVIEVGVNVPNTTVMVVLDPQRFGMAQLHQLRGRVGRSSLASTCVLYGRAVSEGSRARLTALVESTDGFYLSEVDLGLRGPGQMFGVAQSGVSDLNIADLTDDFDTLVIARDDAKTYLESGNAAIIAEHLSDSLSVEAKNWLFKS